MMLAGTPFFKKSTLDKYSWPSSSSWVALTVVVRGESLVQRSRTHAVWFGNPDTGIPIPVEQINPVKKMSRFEWFPGRFFPTSFAMGTSSTLAMVWLIKVDITCGALVF
jgi:hypothetical protein